MSKGSLILFSYNSLGNNNLNLQLKSFLNKLLLVLCILLAHVDFTSANVSLATWASTPVTVADNVVDDDTDTDYSAVLSNNISIYDLNLSLWWGTPSLTLTTSSGTDTLTINQLILEGEFKLIIESGVTLIVNDASTTNKGYLTIKNGGTVIFKNNFTSAGEGVRLIMEDGSSLIAEQTFKLEGGVTSFDISGTITADSLGVTGNNNIDLTENGTINVSTGIYMDNPSTSITGDGSVTAERYHGSGTIFGVTASDITDGTTIQDAYYSRETGDWRDHSTWAHYIGGPPVSAEPGDGDNIIIQDGHTVTNDDDSFTLNKLEIEAGGVLNNGTKNLTIDGELIVNGVLYMDAQKTLAFDPTTSTSLSGGGIISLKQQVQIGTLNILGDLTIESGSDIFLYGNVSLSNGITVSNYGAFEATVDVDGANPAGGSTWINYANSTLKAAGNIMTNGNLNATYSGNTVEYLMDGGVLLNPVNNEYYHLTISGTGDKTQQSDLTVNGDFTINSGNFLSNNFDIIVKGNWTLSADIYNQGNQTVTLDGTGDQTITNPIGEVFYDLIVNKTSGTLTLANDVTVLNSIDMQNGNINTGSNILTLGTLADAGATPPIVATEGTLTHANSATIIGKIERYILDEHTGFDFLFPVGIAASYRPLKANFDLIDATTQGSYGTITVGFTESYPENVPSPFLDDNSTAIYNTFSEGYWTFETSDLSATTYYYLELTGEDFTSFNLDGGASEKTHLLTRINSSSDWEARGNHEALTGSTAKRDSIDILPAEFCFGSTKNCVAPNTSAIVGTNNDTVCINENGAQYYVTDTAGYTYDWEIIPAGAGTITNQDNTGNRSTITVDWGSLGQTATVRVTEENNCTVGTPVDFNVAIIPIAPDEIGGASTVPVGEADVKYNVVDLGYTYNWTVSGGSTDFGSVPDGRDSVYIDWDNNAGTGTVYLTATDGTCGPGNQVEKEVTKYIVIKSIASDRWDRTSTWDCGCIPVETDNVKITDGHAITDQNATKVKNLVIDAGSSFTSSSTFQIYGDLTVNGDLTASTIQLEGSNTEISGIGTITGTVNNVGGSKSILSTSILTIAGDFDNPTASTSIVNEGNLTVTGEITGTDGTISWNNAAHSTLKVDGAILANGILEASSDGNTVVYSGGAANIKSPNNGEYYNLTLSGTGTKTAGADLTLFGDITIEGAASLNVGTYDLTIGGDWTNTSSGTLIANSQDVTFNGTTEQTITGTETFYSLTVNKSSDTLRLASNTNVSNTLNMTSGNIDLSTKTLSLGTAPSTEGNLNYNAGTIVATNGYFTRYFANTASGEKRFPIGTSSSHREVKITIDAISTGGSVSLGFNETDPGATGTIADGGTPVVSVTNQFSDGYWEVITDNGINITDYDIELTANDFSSYTINSATRIIIKDGTWKNPIPGIHYDALANVCKRIDINSANTAYNLTTDTKTHIFGLGHTDCDASLADPIIEGDFDVCKTDDDTYIISVATDNFNSYDWSISPAYGSTADSDNNASFNVTWGTTPTISATISVIAENGCYIAPEVTQYINIHSLPTSGLTGPSNVPNNKEVGVYSVTPRAGYEYTWTLDPATKGTSDTNYVSQGSVNIDWAVASVPETVNVSVEGKYSGCPSTPADAVDMDVTIFNAVPSFQTGMWNDVTTWGSGAGPIPDADDNAYIAAGHTVTLDMAPTIMNLVIAETAVLDNDATHNITLTEGYYNDGNHDSENGNVILNASSANNIIAGSGSLDLGTGELQINNVNQQILATTELTITGNISIGAGLTLYNYGIVNITGDIVGSNADATWNNSSDASLTISGALLTTGKLYATSSGNTINYSGSGQTIKQSSSSQYQNLIISGAGTKSFGFEIDINNDLTINDPAVLDAQNNTLKLYGNWNNNSTGDSFLEGTGTVKFDGGADQTITNSDGTETFYTLNIGKSLGGALILSSGTSTNLSITSNIYFDKGILNTTATESVTFPTNTSTSNGGDADSFIDGPVIKVGDGAFTFPTGDGTRWARIGIFDLSGSETFTAQYFNSGNTNETLGAGLTRVSGGEYWELDRAGGDSAKVRLHWEDSTASGIGAAAYSANLKLAHWTGTEWEPLSIDAGNSLFESAGYITTTYRLESYSPVTVASSGSGNPLPVELTSFTGFSTNNSIELNWTTASELNNDYFEIQHCMDAENFVTIGKVYGNGTTMLESKYSYLDRNPENGTNYYRLVQFDYNGESEPHKTIAVYFDRAKLGMGDVNISVYPNPYKQGDLILNFDKLEPYKSVNISIVDMSGKTIVNAPLIIPESGKINLVPKMVDGLKQGIYMVNVQTNNAIFTKKVIVN